MLLSACYTPWYHEKAGIFSSSQTRTKYICIYIPFLRPILEYASVDWDNCTQYEKDANKSS